MEISLDKLSTPQLHDINDSIDAFLFKEAFSKEPWDPNFKKDPQAFNKLISSMVIYKRGLMKFFNGQYQNRYNLINQHVVMADETDDQWSDYFYEAQWRQDQDELARLIDQFNRSLFDLGVAAIGLTLLTALDFSSADHAEVLTKAAQQAASFIINTTQDRASAAIKAALSLQETRAVLDSRLQTIFVNPYRGSFIAQDQALRSYFAGKAGAAVDVGFTKKTWLGSQAQDKVCGDVNGQTVDINGRFSNGLDGPLAHYGCRCDIAYS